MMARLATWIWIDAYRARVEAGGASLMVERRGAEEAGAVAIKLITLGLGFGAPPARALSRMTAIDGEARWIWLAGPELRPEADVDAALARQARFDPDLWLLSVEDRSGRHFLTEPVPNDL